MLILAIESATDRVGVALGDADGVRVSFEVTGRRRHAETLVPVIDDACAAAGVTLDDVGCVAADVGPGLFTGLRVGLATAKALAHALDLPTVALSSLEILAFPHRHGDRLLASVIDARRGEVYWRLYRGGVDGTDAGDGLIALGEPQCAPAGDLLDDLRTSDEPVLLVGDGALRYREQLADLRDACWLGADHAYPAAAAMVPMAQARRLRGEVGDALSLSPLYLRAPDAQINWSVREGGTRAGGS